MFTLSILWVLLGLLVGAFGIAARRGPGRSHQAGPYNWRIILLIGTLAGLAGGWLGTLLFGRFFGTATSAWIATLAVVVIPWAARRRGAA
jgi:hypothetical protein